jgi:hypothetical protein
VIRGAASIALAAGLAGCPAGMMEQQRRNESDMAACERGDPPSCLRVGRLWAGAARNPLRPDDDVSGERREAIIAYDRACTSDVLDACVEGADFFAAGVSQYETDHPEVLQRMEEGACALGDDDRCFVLARRLVGPDPRRAALVRQVCARSPDRCVEGAGIVWDFDRALALELARRPCDARAAAGCSAAARLDFDQAEKDALLAASCGLHTAADCYELGMRELRDPAGSAKALEHFRTACKLDHAEACTRIGELKSGP